MSLSSRDARVTGTVGMLRFSPLVAAGSDRHHLIDADGRRVLDLSASGGAAGLGYGHPKVVEAVASAVASMPGASHLLHPNPEAVRLGEQLLETIQISGAKVWLGHSGSDAADAATRCVQAATGRSRFVSFIGSYHGGLTGSMAVSGHTAMTHTLPRPGLTLIPYPDPYRGRFSADEIIDLLDLHLSTVSPADQVAAVFLEPIMSDGGVIVPPPGFVTRLHERCRRDGILLVVDEVKVGMGRTGLLHSFQHEGITPDVIIFGKGIGGGLPLSAVVAPSPILDHAFAFAMLTTSGNPVSAAAGNAVLEVLREPGFLETVSAKGEMFARQLRDLAAGTPMIGDVRGRGLALGIDLVSDPETRAPVEPVTTAKIIYRCYQLGVHLLYVGLSANVLELTPPLTIEEDEIAFAVEVLGQAIGDVKRGVVSDQDVSSFLMW